MRISDWSSDVCSSDLVYGASKAYVSNLMRALSVELAGTGVSVGSFAPGGIDTDMAALSDLKWGKLGLMDVDRCAAHAIHALVHRRSFAIPGLGNRLTYLASRALPRSLVSRSEERRVGKEGVST